MTVSKGEKIMKTICKFSLARDCLLNATMYLCHGAHVANSVKECLIVLILRLYGCNTGMSAAFKCSICYCLKCWGACFMSWQLMDHCADWWYTMPWRISLNATVIFLPAHVCYASTSKSPKCFPSVFLPTVSSWRCDRLGSLFLVIVDVSYFFFAFRKWQNS